MRSLNPEGWPHVTLTCHSLCNFRVQAESSERGFVSPFEGCDGTRGEFARIKRKGVARMAGVLI